VAVSQDGAHWIIETKGREDVDVKLKDSAALNWCRTVTHLTATEWKYLKVLQREFEDLSPENFSELLTGITPITSV